MRSAPAGESSRSSRNGRTAGARFPPRLSEDRGREMAGYPKTKSQDSEMMFPTFSRSLAAAVAVGREIYTGQISGSLQLGNLRRGSKLLKAMAAMTGVALHVTWACGSVSLYAVVLPQARGAEVQSSDFTIEAFEASLGKIGGARRFDPSTRIDVSFFFAVKAGDGVGLYVREISKLGAKPITVMQNHRNYVYFNLKYDILSRYSRNFHRGEFLVFSFITKELNLGSEIISFGATLLNSNHL